MVPIKHILYETGVEHIFKLVVPSGNYAGEYIVDAPRGWNDVDSVIDINEEKFNIDKFIIGDSEKIIYSEFNNKKAFDLIRNVYREGLGDGRIGFRWLAKKDGIEYDLLSENFEINFNKYKESFDKTKMKIEVELIKSESQNKFITRYDTTVNLFDTKDLDETVIDPVEKFEIGFKKGNSSQSNFYIFDISQVPFVSSASGLENGIAFFAFQRSQDYQFGDNTNEFAGRKTRSFFNGWQDYLGPFVETNTSLSFVKAKIANMQVQSEESFKLNAVIKIGGSTQNKIKLLDSQPISGTSFFEIKVDYEEFLIGSLVPGQSLTFEFEANDGYINKLLNQKENFTIEITTDIEAPLVHTYGIRLLNAIDQLAKSYTAGEISAESTILGPGGSFYNTSISTGVYLRGLPPIYLPQKLKTSMKSIFDEGSAKLLALGYDILGSKLIVEDVSYFFKDLKSYDLSEKQYFTDSFLLENDTDISFNMLSFGTKKYSTNKRFDIQNFNTTVEITTPIKSNKNKFDKQTDLIIDADKIQELVEDKSSATNDNDDDLVLIDMVTLSDTWDTGVFESCQHANDGGQLLLKCINTPFDTTLIKVGQIITITEGFNTGDCTVVLIDGISMKVTKNNGQAIQEGAGDTRIKYSINNLVKNRTNEGFSIYNNSIRNPTSTANIRHNPKYQMARWWPYFGSGLRRKSSADKLKTTNYKNNSEASVSIDYDMANDLQGIITVGSDEDISRLRNYEQTFFNGERIEISFSKITFGEFFSIYNNWKNGIGGDRSKSRGYITCNTPYGIYDIYPFGTEAFRHNKKTNALTIKGKVRGKSVTNPVLISAVQLDSDTVSLVWDYAADFVNPEIKIQYSFDGSYWENAGTVTNMKTATITNPIFSQIMTGTVVYFRVVVSSADYYNKVSNTLPVSWQFNDWVIREYSKNENTNCGYSYLSLEVRGTVNLEIKWTYTDAPGGGNYSVIDTDNNSVVASYSSSYGVDSYDEQTTTHSLLSQSKYFNIQLKNSDKSFSLQVLNCSSGNMLEQVYAGLTIEAKDLSTGNITTFQLNADTLKKYRQRPQDPTGPTTEPEIL